MMGNVDKRTIFGFASIIILTLATMSGWTAHYTAQQRAHEQRKEAAAEQARLNNEIDSVRFELSTLQEAYAWAPARNGPAHL